MGSIYRLILRKKFEHFIRDRRKLAVFVSFFVVVILYGLLTPKVVRCILPACPQGQWMSVPWRFCPVCSLGPYDYVVGSFYYGLFPLTPVASASSSVTEMYLLLAAQVAYWFILSLIIVWAYDEASKRIKIKQAQSIA